jgi:hypothetical protein
MTVFTLVNVLPKVFVINNLHLTETLNHARDTLKGLSGIYCILCVPTGKVYIGSAVDLFERFSDHMTGHASNRHLQNAIAKYGLSCFVFYVVELCKPDQLLSREQFYLDLFFSTLERKFIFNVALVAGAPMTGRNHTAETKAKLRLAKSGPNHPMYGITGTKNPMYGKPSPSAVYVYVYSVDNVLINSFPSQTAAAKVLNTSQRQVSRYVKSGKLFQGKYLLTSNKLS